MSETTKVEFGWFIPTTGDGEHIGIPPERESTVEYMVQVAQAAEQAGYEFALIPTGGACLDAWVVGSWIAAKTKNFKSLVAMRPGLVAPVLSAQMATTLDQMSQGRVLVNVVTGHYPADLKAAGDALAENHDGRYERTREFLQIVRGVWDEASGRTAETLNFKGEHYEIEGGKVRPAPYTDSHPPLYFGGSSPAGKQVAAEFADVYLMWAEPLDWIQGQINEMKNYLEELKNAKGASRELRYGIRAQLVVRDSEEAAWEAAWNIISKADPEMMKSREKLHSKTDAVNQKRQMELWEESSNNDYVIGPNLWSGLSAIRGGGAVAFVGTPEQVTDRILEFVDIGVTSFILSGYPHLEEAVISGDILMPLLKRKLAERGVHV
ncbi:F420-dependent oxidoreductase [Paenibacillus swuensis]|uniref:F420-dependent oxidoreductase n=1 Tax=Paenibacillus swuensis TaxID=1178515 RepID=A0A172TL54_9BACL|nr:LLM class flavin-dependent oxidoreductase [Paenibacillus swuensis]ANE47712.1 F420-dependent oxidoreductase [Paenibacillus swuensis]